MPNSVNIFALNAIIYNKQEFIKNLELYAVSSFIKTYFIDEIYTHLIYVYVVIKNTLTKFIYMQIL